MKNLLRQTPPGALMLFSYNLKSDKAGIRSFLTDCVSAVSEKSLAPFVAVDHEGGFVHRFGGSARRLPSAESYGFRVLAVGKERTLEEIEYQSFRSAAEIRDLGVTMNFAPVAEILSSENAAFLAGRSYGSDPVFVGQASARFIRGMEKAGIACVVKHFPGNSGVDPHNSLPVLTSDKNALDAMVEPFAYLMQTAHIPAIMVSHAVAAGRDPTRPASLSPLVINGWLRGELGFEGVAIADDFSMSAITGVTPQEAAVEALNAGIDMVMAWPKDLAVTHKAILTALKNKTIARSRLEEAASRVIFQKIYFGFFK
jgi:beta-N-acetylhexosaminidase